MYLKRLLQQKRIEQVISLLQKRLYYNSDYDILYKHSSVAQLVRAPH